MSMLLPLDIKASSMKAESHHLFSKFRFPSLGMMAAPPEVPVEIIGNQLLFSLANDFNFLDWGSPKMKYPSLFVDFTNSDHNIINIQHSIAQYYGQQLEKDPETFEKPLLYTVDTRKFPTQFGQEEIQDLIESIGSVIEKENIRCVFLYGASGFFNQSFYDFVSKLKRLTIEKNACIIITHVIANVMFERKDHDAGSYREALSHSMIHDSHIEASAIFDWIWFSTISPLDIIKLNFDRSGTANSPAGSLLVVNKIIQRIDRIAVNGPVKSSSASTGAPSSLFAFYRGIAPVVMPLLFEK